MNPAIVYDGENAKAIIEAMGLEEGDAVVILAPHKTIILHASQLDMMRREASDIRRDHIGLIGRLLSPGT